MLIDNPPIQEKSQSETTKLFPQVWIKWFQAVKTEINGLLFPLPPTELDFTDNPYTVLPSDRYICVDATAGSVTINLPPLLNAVVKPVSIKKIDVSANTVVVAGDGSETIDGLTTRSINSQWDILAVVPHATEWRRF